MQVDQFGAEVKQVESEFVAPPKRVFKVLVLSESRVLVSIYVTAHMHTINNPAGHLIFGDVTPNGDYQHHRTIHAADWRDVQEVGIVAGKESVN